MAAWLDAKAMHGWSIGSVRADTDCPVNVAREVIAAVARSCGTAMPDFKHKLSFELNPLKRNFVEEMHPDMEHLFSNAMDLPTGYAFDYKQRDRTRIPNVHKLKAGFPCTDVSLLNPAVRQHRNVVSSGSLRTGGVFQAIARYLEACPTIEPSPWRT